MPTPEFTFSSIWKNQLPYNPWVYFFIFLFANTLLSFGPISLSAKLWIGLLGLFLPMITALHFIFLERRNEKPGVRFLLDEKVNSIPLWLWILFLLLLVLTRFYELTSLPFWPISDEGIVGFASLRLSHHWDWRLLYSPVQVEPLAFWLLALYFKVIEPSFFSFRLFSALVSLATVAAGYWAARQYFPRSLAFLFSWLLAFSFWEGTLSRLNIPVIWGPLFECLCFGFLGYWLRSDSSKRKWAILLFLTLFSSMGFYAWINWGGIWLGLAGILFVNCFSNEKKDRKQFAVFAGMTFFIILPLLLARLSAGGATHIHQLLSSSIFTSLAFYGKGIFWNGIYSFPYGSNWGGFFNPILSALVFLGFIFLFRQVSSGFFFGFIFCGLTAALPALLTNNIELYRILLTFPLLTFLAAMGAFGLIANRHHFLSLGGVFLFAMGSFALDLDNYVNHYCNTPLIPSGKQWRNMEYYDAYNILSNLSRKDGPLYVFSEFNTDYDNKTLDVACYPFDALQNPSLRSFHPRWTALITNIQYEPYFVKRFQGMQANILKTDKTGPDDPKPFALFLIPTSQISGDLLDRWMKADGIFKEIDFEVKNKKSIELWASFLESHPSLGDIFPGDPLLSAVYWEKLGFFKFLDGYFIQATQAYQQAIQQGIPAAHLYYNLAVCLKIQGRTGESRRDFKKALSLSNKIDEIPPSPLYN